MLTFVELKNYSDPSPPLRPPGPELGLGFALPLCPGLCLNSGQKSPRLVDRLNSPCQTPKPSNVSAIKTV